MLSAAVAAAWPASVRGQGSWEALLTIDPYPSPYYSDWDANPNIGSLTVFNHGTAAADVRVSFSIIDRSNRVIASGTSDPQPVAGGAAAIFDSPYEVAGRSSHDAEIERIAERTGRLPEGTYTACAAATDLDGFILAEACSEFTILYPDPPLLLGPADGAVLELQDELFQWTPVQVPVEFQAQYVLRIAEVLEGQTPAEALASNIPHHESFDLFTPNVQYPVYARPFQTGTTYAWSVRAFDPNGYPVSANEGRSEIWTFTYDDGTAPTPADGRVLLTLDNRGQSATGGDGEDAGPADTLAGICTYWDDAPGSIVLGIEAIAGFARESLEIETTLYRDDATRAWALVSENPALPYVLYGECAQGALGLGGLQWIALRRSGQLGDLTDGVPVQPGPATELDLRFGAVILSLYSTDTALPEGFEKARDFLDYREIEVAPGLNLFGVVDLKEHFLWPVFQAFGQTDKYVELSGFLGLDASWSVGGRIGGTTADGKKADLEVEGTVVRNILVLRAALPEKTPRVFGDVFETAQVGLEFVVQDSANLSYGRTADSVQWNMDAALDLILAATLDLTRNATEWYGSIAVDFSQEHTGMVAAATSDTVPLVKESCWSKAVGECFKYVLKLGVNGELPVVGDIYLSGLELEIDLNDGFINMLAEGTPKALDWGALGTATLGWRDQDDLAKVMLGIGRTADSVRVAPTAEEIAAQPSAAPMGPAPRPARPPRRPKDRRPPMPAPEPGGTAENQAPRTSPAQPVEPSPGLGGGEWSWGVRIAMGNISLQELLQILWQAGVGESRERNP